MDNISRIWYGPLPADSPYVKPFRLHYVQNGQEKNWDLLKVHDSVAIVIYNRSHEKLVFVKQFRPGKTKNAIIIQPDPHTTNSNLFASSRLLWNNC